MLNSARLVRRPFPLACGSTSASPRICTRCSWDAIAVDAFNTPSCFSLRPRPSDQNIFGELTISHHSPTLPYPTLLLLADCHPLCDVADCVTVSNDPQLLVAFLGRSNGSRALTSHYFIKKLPQPGLRFAEEHFVAGRPVLLVIGAANHDSGDLLGIADAPLIRATIGVSTQHPHPFPVYGRA